MRLLPAFKYSLVMFLVANIFGCGTILHGSQQNISISAPIGASVKVGDKVVQGGSTVVKLDRDKSYSVIMENDGKAYSCGQINKSLSVGIVVVDVILYIVPAIVDAVTGGWNNLEPTQVICYPNGPGIKELQAAPTLQPQNDVLATSNLEEGIQKLAEKISGNMLGNQRRRITIIDFSDLNGKVNAFGQFMSEELTTQLFNIAGGKFEVVDRKQLSKLEEELTLSQTGVIEEKNIKKMGQVLGVDAIITGSMTDLGNTVRINVKIIGVESAKVLAVAATSIPKTGAVADLMAKQAEGKKTAKNTPTTTLQP